jgi:hypothetical protein
MDYMDDKTNSMVCAICLNPVRETRHNTSLRCGHLFHSHCIENWKSMGKQTCPTCRKIFDGGDFKVTITIENLVHDRTIVRQAENEFVFDTLDAFFNVDDVTELESLLADFGVSMSNLDPLILNTE